MSCQQTKHHHGFTLIEIILYVAIIGTVVTSFVSFSISVTNTRNKIYVTQEVQANMRTARELISRDIKQASGVIEPVSGSEGGRLELDMPGAAENIFYSLDNGTIFRQAGTGEAVALTSAETEISDLIFRNIGQAGEKDSLRYGFVASFRNSSSNFFDYSESLASAAGVR